MHLNKKAISTITSQSTPVLVFETKYRSLSTSRVSFEIATNDDLSKACNIGDIKH
jgi:hypothetical protein